MIDIYGIGNALIDREYKATDSQLKAIKAEKGMVSLIDEAELERVQVYFGAQTAHIACGGSVANSMITASQFGAQCFFSSQVASDKSGDAYIKDLNEHNVKHNLKDLQHEDGKTGTCVVLVTPDAQRTMKTYLGITATVSERVLDIDIITQSQHLYIEGYLLSAPLGTACVHKAVSIARQSDVKIALSLSDPFITDLFKEMLLSLLEKPIEHLFCNVIEALSLAETNDLAVAKKCLAGFAKTVLITEGANGVSILHAGIETHVPGIAVKAIDTTGAGDCFAGRYLAAICEGKSIQEAAALANKAAAEVVTLQGPRLLKRA